MRLSDFITRLPRALMTVIWLSACAVDDRAAEDGVAGLAQQVAVDPTWRGDSSECVNAPADAIVKTKGGDKGGVMQEFSTKAPRNPDVGHPGCDFAYVVDFIMPTDGNTNPRWDGAWINAALTPPRAGESDPACVELWQNQKVYAFWPYQGQERYMMLGENSKVGDPQCYFGSDPPKWWMSAVYTRVRIVTQMGQGDTPGLAQYIYMRSCGWPCGD
jgi:hypothetical protein